MKTVMEKINKTKNNDKDYRQKSIINLHPSKPVVQKEEKIIPMSK